MTVMARLRAIDAIFTEMSGRKNADRWTLEALETDSGWSEVRALARQAMLELIGAWDHPMPKIDVIR
ncbi:hypothetical protein [Streptomyces sp. C36]|uniref:hypothetical protein n=1 Tax=Streptomyces sp. C36 TaxID=3237122 RepID=UPI0034C69958